MQQHFCSFSDYVSSWAVFEDLGLLYAKWLSSFQDLKPRSFLNIYIYRHMYKWWIILCLRLHALETLFVYWQHGLKFFFLCFSSSEMQWRTRSMRLSPILQSTSIISGIQLISLAIDEWVFFNNSSKCRVVWLCWVLPMYGRIGADASMPQVL
jgi:hypothetical protein